MRISVTPGGSFTTQKIAVGVGSYAVILRRQVSN